MPKNAERHSRTGIGQAVAGPYRTAAATLSASPALRTFALLTAVNALGNGLFAALSVLYYTRHLGVPVGVVSAVLVAATVLAIGGDLLSGRYSDRASPKPVLLAGLVLSAAATALLLAVDGLISLGQGLCMSSNTTLIRRIARENPALARASLRSLLTLGISAGALLAGLVLADGSTTAFRLAILGDALTFVIAAGLLLRITVP